MKPWATRRNTYGEETDNVVELAKLINDSLVAIEKLDVPGRAVTVDRQRRLTEIGNDVDAGLLEQVHTFSVVGLGVDGVRSDGVGSESSQQRDITLAGGSISQRVAVRGVLLDLATRASSGLLLVGNTLHEELGSVLVEELAPLHDDGVDCGGIARQQERRSEG